MTDSTQPASVPAQAGTGGHAGVDEGAWLPDVFCGSVFVVLGLAFAIGGSRYEIGSAVRMGPGYLPLVLGGALALLGLVTLGQGLVAWRRHAVSGSAATGAEVKTEAETAEGEGEGSIPWARGALVVGAILFFGLTIDGLGVIPTVFVTSLLAALAGQHTKPLRVVITAAGITVVTWLIFVVALQLRLPLFGDWVGG